MTLANISLSSQSSELTLSTSHTPYVPPHPQRGTPYHRYVVLLLPQQSPTEPIEIPAIPKEKRLGFDLRRFAEKYGLHGDKGGGVHMWREIWDPTVSQIYKDTLSTYLIPHSSSEKVVTMFCITELEEPVFGRAPKPDIYAAVKQSPKYT